MRSASVWPFILVAVLLLALAGLAVMQVHWVALVSSAQEQRIHAQLNESGMHVAEDLTHELMQLASTFEMHVADPEEIAHAYARWLSMGHDPRLIRGIYLLDHGMMRAFDLRTHTFGEPQPANEPAELDLHLPIHERGQMHPEHAVPMLVIGLNNEFVLQTLIPSLARRYFETDSAHGFDFAVARGQQIVYRSNPAWPVSVASAEPDLQRPLMLPMMKRREREPPERTLWMMLVRHHGEPLREMLAQQRAHFLTVSLLIVFFLGCSLVLFAYASWRADRLRRQQLEFIAGITHELHTPLAALATAGQNLADGVHVDTAKYGETIVKEARRLTDLVDGVLEFSGMEAGRRSRATEPVDVRDVISDAVTQCSRLAEERGVRVETNAEAALPNALVDREALTRAVQNLVANAIRHGGEGGWVGVRATSDNGSVLIRVADRGAGIPAADMPHLFEPFYRGRNAQTRGSGLGLAIVDRVARAHGGSVTAANLPDRGAEFTLRLPVQS